MGDTRARALTGRRRRKKLKRVLERDGRVCWLCGNRIDKKAPAGSPGALSVDHVVPLNRGGSNAVENLRVAHRSCNTRRGCPVPEAEAA